MSINLDKYKSIWTHWIALYVNDDNGSTTRKVEAVYNAIYFDSFGYEFIPKGNRNLIDNKIIATKIFRIRPYSFTM